MLLALALLLSLAACGGGGAAARGVGEQKGAVEQLMESAAMSAAPAASDTPAPAAASPAPVDTPAAPTDTPAPSAATPEPSSAGTEPAVDVDLLGLNSNMIYAEVYAMMVEPERYVDKTIRLQGYSTSAYYAPTDTTYYAVIIPDATACCAQGIEYILDGDGAYPADDDDITITGRFELYDEEGATFCRLAEAVIE
jgi:hypothetical protein